MLRLRRCGMRWATMTLNPRGPRALPCPPRKRCLRAAWSRLTETAGQRLGIADPHRARRRATRQRRAPRQGHRHGFSSHRGPCKPTSPTSTPNSPDLPRTTRPRSSPPPLTDIGRQDESHFRQIPRPSLCCCCMSGYKDVGSHRRLPMQLPLTWRFSAVSPPGATCFVSHRGSNPSVTHRSHQCAQSCRARPRGCGRSCLCPSSMRCTVCAPFKAVAGHHAPRPSWPLLPSITRWQPRAHIYGAAFRRSAGVTEPAASDSRPQMTWWASTIATVLGIDGQLV